MNAIFPGHIALDDGDAVDVSLTVEGAELRLATPAAPIGSWPLVSCRLDELGPGRYRLTVDDDFVDFSPADPDEFAAFLAGLPARRAPDREDRPDHDPAAPTLDPREPALPPVAGPSAEWAPPVSAEPGPTVAEEERAEIVEVPAEFQGETPDESVEEELAGPTVADAAVEDSRRPVRPSRAAAGVGVGVVVLVVALVVALGGSRAPSPEPASAPVTTEPATVTEEAPPAVVEDSVAVEGPADGSLFSVPAATVVASWNSVAAPISPGLRLDVVPAPGPFVIPLTGEVSVAGSVSAGGSFEEISVVVDATSGIPALGLQALGVAVAVAEPDLDGPARAGVLASIGFDVAAPVTDGVDAAVTREAATYHLVARGGVVTLTVTAQ